MAEYSIKKSTSWMWGRVDGFGIGVKNCRRFSRSRLAGNRVPCSDDPRPDSPARARRHQRQVAPAVGCRGEERPVRHPVGLRHVAHLARAYRLARHHAGTAVRRAGRFAINREQMGDEVDGGELADGVNLAGLADPGRDQRVGMGRGEEDRPGIAPGTRLRSARPWLAYAFFFAGALAVSGAFSVRALAFGMASATARWPPHESSC